MNKCPKILIPVLFAGILLWVLAGCQKKETPSDIVATVGDQHISYFEFMMSYMTNPGYRNNVTEREARLAQLDYLKDKMYMYLAAEAEDLGNSPDILEKVDYIRNRETLKYLYQKEIWSQIPVTEEETWEEFKRHNIKVKVRHLFAPGREQAEVYYNRLQSGEPFSALAKEVFKNTQLAETGGDLGWLTVNMLDPLLVDSVYNARLGIPTQPLQSSFGWHVFLVEDVEQQVFLNRHYFEQNRDTYETELRKRRAQRLSEAYLKDVLKGKSVTIKGPVLGRLLSVNQTHLPMQQGESPVPQPSINNAQLLNIARDSREFLDQTLVEFDGGSWTVLEFLNNLRRMPPMQRPEKLFEQDALAQHIIDMVRDHYLLQEAKQKGYDQAEPVQREVARWRRNLIATEFERRIRLVDFQQADSALWAERRARYERIKAETPTDTDTNILFQGMKPADLEKRVRAIPLVLKSDYLW